MNDPLINRLRDFVDASPAAWQAVDSMAALLDARGGERLREGEAWRLEPGKMYYIVRSGTAILAFRPGLRPPAEEGFAIAGAHTDSPGLKARLEKPLSGRGMERVPVELYGNPIVSTWLDRPLALAGRVVLRAVGREGGPGFDVRLVNTERAVGLVPNLALHLNREINKGIEYNAQTHLPVLLASRGGNGEAATVSALTSLLAGELDVAPGDILGADLLFVEAAKTQLIGEDLVNGYRLDDLLGCHAILEAFADSLPTAHGQVAAFFDSEEIGSRTIMGADSSLLRDLLGRISSHHGTTTEGFYRALSSSFSVSVDVAQAYHPSYGDKFDESYSPLLNGGPAVKAHAGFRYATDSESEARFRILCSEAGVPCQKFMTRADMSPGSTIGPYSAAHTGISTVDVGSPLLSMHSIRETAGTRDHAMMISVLTRHFARSPKRC